MLARLVNLRKLASPHWLLLVVLAAGALLRIAVAVAYRPGLFYQDSWDYIDLAYGSPIVGVSVQHPFGYPLLLHGLALVQRSLTTITTTQHLAGLIGGVVLYAILVRLRVSRTLSALAVAVVALDIYVVTLEQYILSEAFFGLTLLGSAYFAIRGERRTAELAASGLLLAVATSLRTAALFAVPAWLGYLLWTRRGLRGVVAAALALTLPLLAYATYSARRLLQREAALRRHLPLRPSRRARRLSPCRCPCGHAAALRAGRALPAQDAQRLDLRRSGRGPTQPRELSGSE